LCGDRSQMKLAKIDFQQLFSINFKIAYKIWILTFSAVIMIVVFFSFNKIVRERTINTINTVNQKEILLLDYFRRLQLISANLENQVIISIANKSGLVNAGKILRTSFLRTDEIYREINLTNDGQIATFTRVYDFFKGATRKMETAFLNDDLESARFEYNHWKTAKEKWSLVLIEQVKSHKNSINKAFSTEVKWLIQSDKMILYISAVSIAISVLLSYFLITRINRPLAKVENIIGELGAGQLTSRLNLKSGDEVGSIANTLDTYIDRLSKIISTFMEHTSEIAISTKELAESASKMEKTTDEISISADQEADLLNLSKTVIQDIAKSTRETAGRIKDLQSVASNAEKEAGQIDQAISKLEASMSKILQSGDQIRNIITVITDIADQTNVLSMNAAIEAAKAGEYGKGFAVVAEEIRTLSERSSASVTEIQQIVDQSTDDIQKGNDVILETNNLLQGIIKLVQQISGEMGNAAKMLKEQDSGMQDLSHSAEGVTSIGSKNASSVSELSETTAQNAKTLQILRDKADDLLNELSYFTIN